MKQVRFDTPRRSDPRLRNPTDMCEVLDCQEPRPPANIHARFTTISNRNPPGHPIPYSSDQLDRYAFTDSTPYATKSKTVLPALGRRISEAHQPSSELELSRIDSSDVISKDREFKAVTIDPFRRLPQKITEPNEAPNELPRTLKLQKNVDLPNVLYCGSIDNEKSLNEVCDRGVYSHIDEQYCNVEKQKMFETINNNNSENPLKTKVFMPKMPMTYLFPNKDQLNVEMPEIKRHCSCHECIPKNNRKCVPPNHSSHINHSIVNPTCLDTLVQTPQMQNDVLEPSLCSPCGPAIKCRHSSIGNVSCCPVSSRDKWMNNYRYGGIPRCHQLGPECITAEDKTRAIEKYDQKFKALDTGKEVEKQTTITKEKREPTVSDLFRIIKLQNEQLKLLQDQVDRLLIKSQPDRPEGTSTPFRPPVKNFIQERVAVETVDSNLHKISIGVMTSFEVVRTATVNPEKVAKNTAQIQCNRSQVSIREIISASEQYHPNFLDGIAHVGRDFERKDTLTHETNDRSDDGLHKTLERTEPEDAGNNDKTVNELSLFNFQIDNAVTPQLSPDQTLYLDVKDYSDSDNDDESRVGWTYYNKVMGHVNEMLQESCVPSSAGALHRRAVAAATVAAGASVDAGARCTRLHVDRTDVSITTSKRVTFGQHPIEPPRPFPTPTASSDTSLHINRLAAKYLRNINVETAPRNRTVVPMEMSMATRKYMEQHNLIGGVARTSAPEVPTKFLDITALKQQPKLL